MFFSLFFKKSAFPFRAEGMAGRKGTRTAGQVGFGILIRGGQNDPMYGIPVLIPFFPETVGFSGSRNRLAALPFCGESPQKASAAVLNAAVVR